MHHATKPDCGLGFVVLSMLSVRLAANPIGRFGFVAVRM
jgi:hypothetical protein